MLPSPVRMTLPRASRPIAIARSAVAIPTRSSGSAASVTAGVSDGEADRGQESVPVRAEPAGRARHVRRELHHDVSEAANRLGGLERPAQSVANLLLVRLGLVRLVLRVVEG